MTLTEFLLEQIAGDEGDAQQLDKDLDRWERETAANGPDGRQGSIVASTLRGGAFDPARVLAECEAKRRIVERTAGLNRYRLKDQMTLQDLALPYADHPDFQPEWRLPEAQ
jgi:hypothetical protein